MERLERGCNGVTLFGSRRQNSKRGNPDLTIEIGFTADAVVIRDSNDPSGLQRRFSRAEWEALERAVRRHQFEPGRQSEKYVSAGLDPESGTFVLQGRPFAQFRSSLRRLREIVAWTLVFLAMANPDPSIVLSG
jgi:Domain of unknown function (DUF397)